MTDNAFFVLNEYEGSTANKRQLFGVRGMGKQYDAFWDDIGKNFKPTYDHADWPWSYLAFDEEQEKEFRRKYGSVIEFQERDADEEPYDCVIDNPPPFRTEEELFFENELHKILKEEIQKELIHELIPTTSTPKS